MKIETLNAFDSFLRDLERFAEVVAPETPGMAIANLKISIKDLRDSLNEETVTSK